MQTIPRSKGSNDQHYKAQGLETRRICSEKRNDLCFELNVVKLCPTRGLKGQTCGHDASDLGLSTWALN